MILRLMMMRKWNKVSFLIILEPKLLTRDYTDQIQAEEEELDPEADNDETTSAKPGHITYHYILLHTLVVNCNAVVNVLYSVMLCNVHQQLCSIL